MKDVIVRNPETRRNIVTFMVSYALKHNREASVREISEAVGITSTSTMAGYLERMVREGSLAKNDAHKRRIYSVTDYGERTYKTA